MKRLAVVVLALAFGLLLAHWQRQASLKSDADLFITGTEHEQSGAGKPLSLLAATANSPAAQAVATATDRRLPDDIELQQLDVAYWQQRGQDPLLNADLVRIFEQLLGRHSDAVNDAAALLDSRIPARYQAQAQQLLMQYQHYREALAQLTAPRGASTFSKAEDYAAAATSLETVILARRALQETYFSAEEIEGLFGDDHRYDQFTVARLRLAARDDLSMAEKTQQLDALGQQLLTAEQREARHAATLPLRITAQNETAQLSAASNDERLAQRSQDFGDAAAQRMAALDRQQSEWQERIARYANADPVTQQQLRLTEFTPQEQLRLSGAVSLYQRQQGMKNTTSDVMP